MIRVRSHYQILQVDPAADAEIINLVYRRLAQRYHPDRDASPVAQTKMVELNEAWDVLKERTRRAAYDAELSQRRDRRASDRPARRADEGSFRETGYGEAGEPPGQPEGSVLDFGRYRGWTLGQIARQDRDFLEWLERMPAGRTYHDEIAKLLGRPRRAR